MDLSEGSLSIAKENASREALEISFVRSDMREISFSNELDAAINMFTAFGYFASDEEDQRAVDAVARALRSDAGFLMDFINPLRILRHEHHGWLELEDGTIWLDERRYDAVRAVTRSDT